jgi:hypothetical protein
VDAGDDGHEAYTAIMRSGLLSRERDNPAEAEAVAKAEGNMLRTVMRGATTLPWSETPLRMKGARRNPLPHGTFGWSYAAFLFRSAAQAVVAGAEAAPVGEEQRLGEGVTELAAVELELDGVTQRLWM